MLWRRTDENFFLLNNGQTAHAEVGSRTPNLKLPTTWKLLTEL
jgi:hypothetical protein